MDWSAFALLLIDVQQDFWTAQRQERHPQFPANVGRLLAYARAEDLAVVHLRAAFEADGSNWMARHRLLGQVPCPEWLRQLAQITG